MADYYLLKFHHKIEAAPATASAMCRIRAGFVPTYLIDIQQLCRCAGFRSEGGRDEAPTRKSLPADQAALCYDNLAQRA
jgi:hypothetical protein